MVWGTRISISQNRGHLSYYVLISDRLSFPVSIMVRVAFIHPDLGIGGAERLIVDAALALKSRGHEIEMFTAHHDPGHCFSETRDGTLMVSCAGDWLPRHCFQKGGQKFDVIVCDQISACIPVLRWSGSKVLFYCHFPDQLLTKRQNWMKKIYRWPIDRLEESTTGKADQVLVNSRFTAHVFHSTFKSLARIHPMVLYPSLNFSAFDQNPSDLGDTLPPQVEYMFLSINRYERKKNLRLAIEAFSTLVESMDSLQRPKVHLVMAGGYDERVVENKEHYIELRRMAEDLKVSDQVTFLRSFTDQQKVALLSCCTSLIYTPSNEHFGICPLEAMFMRRPVIAVNSGGPLETVVDGKTGFLCDPTADAFARQMLHYIQNPEDSREMGEAGRDHVIENFSFEAFTEKLNAIITNLCEA